MSGRFAFLLLAVIVVDPAAASGPRPDLQGRWDFTRHASPQAPVGAPKIRMRIFVTRSAGDSFFGAWVASMTPTDSMQGYDCSRLRGAFTSPSHVSMVVATRDSSGELQYDGLVRHDSILVTSLWIRGAHNVLLSDDTVVLVHTSRDTALGCLTSAWSGRGV